MSLEGPESLRALMHLTAPEMMPITPTPISKSLGIELSGSESAMKQTITKRTPTTSEECPTVFGDQLPSVAESKRLCGNRTLVVEFRRSTQLYFCRRLLL
jgi:hypothetical protein